MNRHLTPILSSNDNTKAFRLRREEITADFIKELDRCIYNHLRTNGCVERNINKPVADMRQDILDLIIDFNPTKNNLT